jgi:phosphoglycolate phosphatase
MIRLPSSRIAVVIFDLDGTLTDPYLGISRCFAYAMEALGKPLSADHDFRPYIGPPIQTVFARLCGHDEHIQNQAIALYRERFASVGMYENTVYNGIVEMLCRLRENFKLYLCTSKPRPYAEAILAHFHLTQFFEAAYGSEMNGALANKAELLCRLLTHECIEPQEAVIIGDRSHDIIAGNENRIATAGVLWGYGSIEELRGANCSRCFLSPEEITVSALKGAS